MRPRLNARPGAFLAITAAVVAVIGALATAGCDNPAIRVEGGPDMRYLTAQPPSLSTAGSDPDRAALPLTPGTTWQMAVLADKRSEHPRPEQLEIRVVPQPVTVPGAGTGTLLELRKSGKLWRRELYRATATDIQLLAVAEEDHPYMIYQPGVPILHYPITEGWAVPWSGTFSYGGHDFSARGLSRISTTKSLPRLGGKQLLCYRVDTLIVADIEGDQVRFPSVRWLSPGTGFVQRAFVDHGEPLFTMLEQVTTTPATTAAAGADRH